MNDDFLLYVNKQIFGGWLDTSVTKSIKAIAGSFDLSVTNRWTGQKTPWDILPLDECELKHKSESIITGYVDKIAGSLDANAKTMRISGRDKTADLVDCSYMGPKTLSNISLLNFFNRVCKPFGIKVTSEIPISNKTDTYEAQQGETVFEFMERVARLRGYLLSPTHEGNIVIAQLGKKRAVTSLVEGKNILDFTLDFDSTQRFSDYHVRGQMSGDDDFMGDQTVTIEGSAKDPGVSRYRPIVISAEGKADNALAKDRAKWEAITRAAKASRFSVSVKGWEQGDGSLWKENLIVPLIVPSFNISMELLVSEITYSNSSEGRRTSMVLERADSYKNEPISKKSNDVWKELSKV